MLRQLALEAGRGFSERWLSHVPAVGSGLCSSGAFAALGRDSPPFLTLCSEILVARGKESSLPTQLLHSLTTAPLWAGALLGEGMKTHRTHWTQHPASRAWRRQTGDCGLEGMRGPRGQRRITEGFLEEVMPNLQRQAAGFSLPGRR